MSETPITVDLQAEAEIAWWQDAHAMVETKRLKQEDVMRKALKELENSLQCDDLAEAWRSWQKARKMLKKALS